MADADLLVQASGLTLRYGASIALRDVDLEVRAGQFWFFLGPNGSGKTTLLRAIMGQLQPASGSLVLHSTLRDRAGIGFVPQRCDPNPVLPTTVREFVTLGLVGVPAGAAERRERLVWALAHVGLAGFEHRSYWELSGGERQRALVARALVRRPRLLILDEPTNHLDFVIESAILDLLVALQREEHTAVVFVTHALHLAQRHATHAASFGGGVVETGEPAALLRPESLARRYRVGLQLDAGVPT